MIYFKFKFDQNEMDDFQNKKHKRSFFEQILVKILPTGNPDFEDKIPLVAEWLIEYENIKHYVNREIGKNKNGEIIVKMPDDKNYGYWSDNILKYNDFEKHFEIEDLSQEQFIEYWENQ